MKKSSIFMTVGTFVLAVTGIFAVKANKRAPATSLFYKSGSTYVAVISNCGSSVFTTTPGIQAYMTEGSTVKTLYWGQSTTDPAYAPF